MTNTRAKLVYFNQWMTGHAVDILAEHERIDLTRLEYSADQRANEAVLKSVNGYQIMPRTELDPRYVADLSFVAKMDSIVAICSTGAGYDMIDVDACSAAGIIVCNQSGTNKEAVAEHVFGFMLGLSKKMFRANLEMHTVDRLGRSGFDGNDIFGKTLGIVGIGQIGARTAELARAFNMDVIAYDPYLSEADVADRGAKKVDWETLFSASDFVTVHCPRTDETLHMVNGEAFAMMKPSAYFITTARGGIHKEDDLAAAVESGQIAGAGIDVWWEEPTPLTHALLQLENVVASPHIAGMTHEAMANMGVWAAEQWVDIFEGKVPPRLVNSEAWDRYRARFADRLGFSPVELQQHMA